MKRHWINYHPKWQHGPMTYWVHRADNDSSWSEAKEFDPPAPRPVGGRGFPMFHVDLDGVPFRFASLHEMRACISTLSKKVLPTTAQIVRERGLTGLSNNVWLGRLPKKTHSLRYRERALPYLRKALAAFEKEVPNQALPVTPASGTPRARARATPSPPSRISNARPSMKLSHEVSRALRTFSYFLASGTHHMLEGVSYLDLYGKEPGAIEQAYAIFANVLELDEEGRVTNLKHAEKRATDYLRSYCDPAFRVEPTFEDWEVALH